MTITTTWTLTPSTEYLRRVPFGPRKIEIARRREAIRGHSLYLKEYEDVKMARAVAQQMSRELDFLVYAVETA